MRRKKNTHCWLDLCTTGSRDSANVFIEYAGVGAANKDAAGVWETPICESDICGGYVTISEPCRIPGTINALFLWRSSQMDIGPRSSNMGHGARGDAKSGLGRWAISVTAWLLTKWLRSSGNVELLEAITAYSQILPRKRRFRCEAASRFHAVFLGGTTTLIPSLLMYTKSWISYANHVHYRRVATDILHKRLILSSVKYTQYLQTSTVQFWCLLSIMHVLANLDGAIDIKRNAILE